MHLNNFLSRFDPFPSNFSLQYVPRCESEPDEMGESWNTCSPETWEAEIACTQKYISRNFLPTILCYNEKEYRWGEITREECISRSLECSDPNAESIEKNIQNCVEKKEGENLVKKARKLLPKERNRTTNGSIKKKKTLFNKPPKELLCGLKSLKNNNPCLPCIR